MKKISKITWLDILASPFVLALPIAIGVILILPDVFQKYTVTQTYSGLSDKPNSIEEYHDLDYDGYSERVVAFPNEIGFAAIKVLHNDGSTVDQWNFTGKDPSLYNRFYCADLNNDSLMEIYVFTVNKDTLYLNAFDPLYKGSFIFQNKSVSVIAKYNDSIDIRIGVTKVIDLDGDGFDELVFIVNAGYSKQPRGIFAYNAHHDTIIRTPQMGANLGSFIYMDEDNKIEIFCSSSTVGNIPDSMGIPYSDYSSWLMAFDEKLKFLFPPIEFDAYQSGITIDEIQSGGKNRVVAFFNNRSKSDLPSMIAMFSKKGEIIRKKIMGKDGFPNYLNAYRFIPEYKGMQVIAMKTDNHSVTFLDTLLNPVKTIKRLSPGHLWLQADLDKDCTDELVFSAENNSILITQTGFESPVGIEIDRKSFSTIPFCVSVKQNGNNLPELFIKVDNNAFLYTYQFNKLYYLKYPLWLGIYFVILAVILLIRYLQKIQLQHKMEIENRLNALQLKTIKSQMDPHFMFNALNSISTSILNRQNETAHRFLLKFSNLLRSMFSKAGELSAPLEEQLEFVENYLELEKLRFKDMLSCEIDISPAVDQSTQLPRMLIQLLVENAIKHGLRHKKGEGQILIKITQAKGKIQIIVEDDGIGRRAAGQHPDGHGKGLTIIDEMTGLFEKVKGVRITYRYEDLFDKNGQAAGTRVVVDVPVG